MARYARIAPGGWIYHIVNRTAGRFKIFKCQKDFLAFEQVMALAHERFALRILSYCIMSNHWHFVVWPENDGDLTAYFRWLTHTHAMRWRVAHQTVGFGHLYQGRFKSFPVQSGPSLLAVCRYVERNALTAGLVKNAEDWRWSSLWLREHGTPEQKAILDAWPTDRPDNWVEIVNKPLNEKEIKRWQQSMQRNSPFGDEKWIAQTAEKLDMKHTIRSEGRPKRLDN